MSEVVPSEDSFTSAAGKQLLIFAALAIGGLALLMLGLSWASSLTGSASGGNNAVDPATNSITVFLREEPPQLNSSLSTDQVSGSVLGHVIEGLLRYDENNRLAPAVAERWELRENGATFWLREDARWSDGAPVTAHDFVFGWQTGLNPANASEYAFILYAIKNGEAINKGEMPVESLGVRALDDHTLEVDFERPLAYFDKLVAFSTYSPIREDFYRAMDGAYGADADKLLYNGPFVISSWVHGASLRMDKNPLYWDKDRAKLDTIDFAYITSDANATLNLFKDNKIAYASLQAENLNNAMEQRWQINRFMDGSIFYIEFNHREGRVTANHHLRKALQLATDSAELVYKVTKLPGYLPGESLFPVWLKGVDGFLREEYPANYPTMDVEKARWHLAQAKQELGINEFPPLVLLSGDNPISSIQSEYYQQVFKKHLGLEIKIDKQIFKQRLAKMLSGDFDMVLAGWGPDYDDPLTFGDLFASWNLNNRGQYRNPELDQWVRVAQNEQDVQARMDAFGEIQRILIDDAVILPNYERGITYVTHPQLKGMVRRAVGSDPDFSNAWIEE
ncbi:MAG: peptide ABC transporter substrate-binding protein [Gammaproteobacteria bacterium]|jgi:oligopeptide transport system substrate-binding protein|nr:MAG: peptide ABC transporter substrate-binding protein [Gammaproteobacteria bacterium]